MTVKAMVFLVVEPRMIGEVASTLANMEGVEKVYEITGQYDVVAILSSKDYETLASRVRDEILRIEGVLRSVTSFIVAEYGGE